MEDFFWIFFLKKKQTEEIIKHANLSNREGKQYT